MSSIWVKVCGVTRVDDAAVAADAGADAIGLNFVPGSPRRIDVAAARAIAGAVRGRVEIVGVVADLEGDAVAELARDVGLDVVQLHGDETPEAVASLTVRLGARVIKAVRLGARGDVEAAARFAGDLLVDARVAGALGGTGRLADWTLAAELARARPIVLAGGLGPENVAAAIAAVRPAGVDAASGVESAPGVKDEASVRAFVAAARSA